MKSWHFAIRPSERLTLNLDNPQGAIMRGFGFTTSRIRLKGAESP